MGVTAERDRARSIVATRSHGLRALLVGAALAACSSDPASPAANAVGGAGAAGASGAAGSAGAEPGAGTSADAGAASIPAPDTAAGHQLAWILVVMNEQGGAASDEEFAAHFTPAVLEQLPAAQLRSVLSDLAAQGAPLALVELDAASTDTALRAIVVGRDGTRAVVTLSVDPATGLIDGLFFSPDLESSAPRSWDEVDAAVAALAPRSSYLVARVDGAECTPLHGARSEDRLAIGSTFKLYVLAELSRQIEAGTLSWDSTLSIRDALKSLPSGQLQNLPEGTELSLLDVATPMIAISDNTATDHLIDRLGRENVESALAAFGHGAPELNTPLLMTRELFLFKLGLDDGQVDSYLAADVAGRRAFLDGLAGQAPDIADAEQWVAPRRIDQVEWFASTTELCKVMAALDVRAAQPGLEPIAAVLSTNPGLALDPAAFPYIAYKGGSEPGVEHLSWLVHSATGARYFVSLGLNDPTAPLDEEAPLPIAIGIFELLASGG